MIPDSVDCRLCGSAKTDNLGKIPDCGEFAGQSVMPSIKGGCLMECLACDSLFRSPLLSPVEYFKLYKRASDDLWEHYHEIRNDFKIIRDLLSDTMGGEILDVGCYSGVFLRDLPTKFEKFGIEPSEAASSVAHAHGITILGQTLAQIDPHRQFDIIMAIDVVEHVTDVSEFMGQVLQHVKENGLFIISTGNPDCLFWKKIFKSRFWYTSFSEHLTFPSRKYFDDYCKRAGLAEPLQIPFPYVKLSPVLRFVLFISQVMFFISPAIFRFSERVLRKMIGMADRLHHEFGLVAGGLFTDHQLIVIKKIGCER